jgi:hypothetical protein
VADTGKPVEVPVAEHIGALRERTAAAFNIAAAHARDVDVLLRCSPTDPNLLHAAEAARKWMTAALALFVEMGVAQRHAGVLAAERRHAETCGEVH